jgi:hypothetical protein
MDSFSRILTIPDTKLPLWNQNVSCETLHHQHGIDDPNHDEGPTILFKPSGCTSPQTDELLEDEDWKTHFDHLVFRKQPASASEVELVPASLKELVERTDLCAICTECMRTNLCATCCGHVFHTECLSRWFHTRIEEGQGHVCPICRTLQKTKPISLFIRFEEEETLDPSIQEHRMQFIRDARISMLLGENQALKKERGCLMKEKMRLSKYIGELLGKNLRLRRKLKQKNHRSTARPMPSSDPSPSTT